jgi:flavin-dependent dehydrogenase
MFGEGISSALASGIIAGSAAAGGIREKRAPGEIYREKIEAERMQTLTQFDLKTQVFGDVAGSSGKDRMHAIMKNPLVLKDMLSWASKRGGIKKRVTPN